MCRKKDTHATGRPADRQGREGLGRGHTNGGDGEQSKILCKEVRLWPAAEDLNATAKVSVTLEGCAHQSEV